MLSLRLSRALAQGRAARPEPPSRAALLAALLRKRAAAHNVGAQDLEALLRDQIRWSLPMEAGQIEPRRVQPSNGSPG
ncbi:hypothetical protein G4G27_19495 [Sphingomonas sp. So64.6b]|uniref:hypothetical protein n=1 Tax=Sphingomonas sp. So64.6b TaxID=2997354 RepID=UPI001600417E|nr:hypothetical protein [Sphingomonas sp. So64.6b]QNA85919.1 hypothetical protein G4G27_19495 [Sphingomonas sp. So64.6b]